MLSTAILAWFHIIFAMMWLGGGVMFAVVVAPALAKLSPASSGEFFVKVVPRVARFFQIVAGLTILFGVLLVYVGISNGDFPGLDLSTKWGLSIIIGLSIGVVALLVSEFLAVPPLLKVIAMIKEMQASGQHQPPAELPKTLRRASLTANASVILVVLTLVLMVSAGFY
jgi:uncharacterized membrane protein